MRCAAARLAAALALVLPLVLPATGCKHKERYDRDTVTPVQADPSLGVSIDVAGTVVAKPSNGDLNVPLRVRNNRSEAIRVLTSRSEVELTNGTRCRSREDESIVIAPDSSREFGLLFGDRSSPVTGNSFRIYLWFERTNGKGLLEFVPPLVIKGGAEPFAFPPRPFQKDPGTGRPVDDEFPPVSPRSPPGPAPGASGVGSHPCPACGEPRPDDAGKCPHCGTP